MNKFSITFILLLHIINVKGQKIKEYSGNFEDGKATYQYYENDQMDRILHGNFSYTGALFDMQGNFVNGDKNGKWIINAQNKKYSNSRVSIKLNTNINGNYKNGLLEGYWQYKNTMQFINNSSDKDIEISTASFKNNHFIGKVTYHTNFPVDYNVTGQFNESGVVDGTWIYTKGEKRDEIRFYKGVAYWRLYNDTETGEKKIFCDSTSFVKEFWKNYNSKTETSTVNGKVYYPDTVLINQEVRVLESNGTYAKKRIINTIKIGDPSMSIEGTFNPICIWMQDNVVFYFDGAITNPLYYYKKGSVYPYGKQIIINECSYYTDCYKKLKKREQAEKERIKKEKERKELLERRKNTNYDLEQKKRSDYNNLETKISELITTEIQKFSSDELTLSGKITFFSDTLGTKSFDFSNLQSNNLDYLKLIKIKLQNFNIHSILEKEYKFNTFANYSINSSYYSYNGEASFKIKEKQGKKTITYIDENPESNIQNTIKNYYRHKTEGKYKISYKIILLNGKTTADFETIQFKENKLKNILDY